MLRTAFVRHRHIRLAATASVAVTGVSAVYLVSSKKEHKLSSFTRDFFPFINTTQCSQHHTIIVEGQHDNTSTSLLKSSISDTDMKGTTHKNGDASCSPSSSSIFIPTLQATNRARKLVQTILLMIMDYEKAKFEKSEFMESLRAAMLSVQSTVSVISNNENQRNDYHGNDGSANDTLQDEQKYWEEEIERRKERLESAQYKYTISPSEDELERWAEENGIINIQSRRDKYQGQKKHEVREAANQLGEAEEMLSKLGDRRSTVHMIAARRLLQLCRENGGVYVKIGQHLANLDYLIPEEYIKTLSELFDDAPVSSYMDVCEVIKEELGKYPDELFESFSEKPIASASLAQVHVAIEKGTGRKLAVKVQHRGLRETSVGDLKALETAIGVIDGLFEDFTYGWIVDEIAPNLPIELDFSNEGRNAEKAANHILKTDLDCVIPEVLWNRTTSRVLCMQFEEGFKCTNLEEMKNVGLDKKDVAQLISSVFNAQVFQSGFVHCDPHPANVLLREHPTKKGKPQIVLVDHGLYKQIDDEFRITYAKLWESLMMADLNGIKTASEKLGIGEMYPLLAAMLTSRPFDEIMERSKSGSIDSKSNMGDMGDKAMIQGYVQRYIKEIFSLLDLIPRQMLLLLKMNDCLRHVDFALGSPSNTLVVAGSYASAALYEHNHVHAKTRQSLFKNWMDYLKVRIRIQAYEIALWWVGNHRCNKALM